MSLVVSNNRFFLSYCTNCLVSYCASWRLFIDLLQRVVGDYYTQGTLSLELFLLFFILKEGFCMSSTVAHLFKEEDLKDCIQGEKCLANGDIYIGSCHGSLPEGLGKYLWADGCMYEGQWSKGQKIGKGKVSWPSGSTYEGEFVGGCLNGYGTFTGVDGSTYKGQWLSNQMHGYGHKFYQNGDVYEGYWKHGIPEGKGRYMWVNGNEYSGYWKSGSISGKGVLRWSNGDKYEGFWIDGLEHGHGIYRWADGSCYVGTWNRGLKDGKGVFYPPLLYPNTGGFGFDLSPSPNWRDREDGMRDRWVSTDFDLTLSNQSSNTTPSKASETISATYSFNTDKCSSTDSVDSSCVTESDDFEECCSGDGADDATLFTVMEREYAQGVLVSEVSKETYPLKLQRRQKRNKNEKKRPGEIIFKGHRNYDLMLNLQLGIRYTVGRITPEPKRDIVSSDFGPKARIWMRFPPEGTTATPTHQSVEFKWKDYCPMVFRNLRELFKLDAADYMMSICGSDVLRELSSPGKSGSVFYLSHDDRFMIKTMKKSEVKALLRMLPNYYDHIRTYPNTLITRFFGLHAVKPVGCQKVRLVVMHNMFCSDLRIHRRFDLKGSSQGRSTNNSEIDETTTLKDLDLDFVFHLQPSWRGELMKQIDQDCKFLESEKIMDYSLLLGIHLKAPQGSSVVSPASSSNLIFTSSNDSTIEDDNQSKRSIMSPEHESVSDNSLTRYKSEINSPSKSDFSGNSRLQIRLGVNMPARATRMLRRSEHDLHPERELFPEDYDAILYFGIIDILQEYDISKKLEHAYKSFQFDALSISAVDPKQYSKRFRDFMTRIFP